MTHSPDDFVEAAGKRKRGRDAGLSEEVVEAIERVIAWADAEPERFAGYALRHVYVYVKSCTDYKPNTPESLTRTLRYHYPDLRARLLRALGRKV